MNHVCLNCGVEYDSPHKISKYCSRSCQLIYQNRQKQLEWEERWLAGEVDGNKNTVWTAVSGRVRTYLMKKYNNKCAIC